MSDKFSITSWALRILKNRSCIHSVRQKFFGYDLAGKTTWDTCYYHLAEDARGEHLPYPKLPEWGRRLFDWRIRLSIRFPQFRVRVRGVDFKFHCPVCNKGDFFSMRGKSCWGCGRDTFAAVVGYLRSVEIDLYSTTNSAIVAPDKVDFGELFDLLDAAIVQNPAAIKHAITSTAAQSEVWRGGVAPMRFDEFCIALDPDTALFPRQKWIFERIGMLDPWGWIRPDKTLTEIVLCHGKGAGKDFISSRVIAYFTYVILNIKPVGPTWKSRSQFFGLAPDVELAIVNVAPSGEHAKTVFFGQYLSRWFKHPIFAEFNPDVGSDRISFFTPEELARCKVTKNTPSAWLRCYSKHSKAAAFDGMNVLGWVMDETDDFLDTADSANADDVYGKLRGSAGTRFNDRWLGMAISYPRVKGGFILRAWERAKEEMQREGASSSTFGDFAATKDVNPKFNPNSKTVQADYARDPRLARAMYECEPLEAEEAFFDMPDRIYASVDKSRQPVAEVTEGYVQFTKEDGSVSYFVSATIGNIRRRPGYAYYLGGDAGHTGDAFALAVFHVDTNDSAFEWICPRCALENPNLRSYGDYAQHGDVRMPVTTPVHCGACHKTPAEYTGGWMSGIVSVRDWWRRSERAESALLLPAADGLDGEVRPSFNIPHVYEDLLIRVKPVRKVRSTDVERPVYFPGMQDLCYDIMTGLGIVKARFDPWQTVSITQGLMSRTGGDVQEISFAQPEQYKRARLVKHMLYADLITLLPNDARDKEWARLQRKNGNKIDHPQGAGEGKDCFDAESVAITTAVSAHCSNLSVFWG